MNNGTDQVKSRHCANCGLELPASGWEGLCPKCLVSVSVRGMPPALEFLNTDVDADSPVAEFPIPSTETKPDETEPLNGTKPSGRCLGDYELLEELGRGGMGIVFKARQISLNRVVAVKMLIAGPAAGGRRLERFRAEAESIAQLQHPNIVAIYGVGEHSGAAFFSMEYVPGRTLAELAAERPLAPETAVRYVRTIAEAVQYAHEHGIIHRDLKPSNVLIDGSGRPRVTDFGLAKRMPGSSDAQLSVPNSDLTLTGQVLGSPSYLAPEQAGEVGAVGPASDVYALGAILFHLLTGRPPFLSETLEGTLLQVLTTEPVSVRRLNPAVPGDLETICAKCLQKEPHRRYASAQALAEDLGCFLEHRPIAAQPVGPIARLWRWCQRRPAMATILALLQLSFAAGLSGILWEWHRARSSELSLQRSLYAADVHLAQMALEDHNLGRTTELLRRYIPWHSSDPDLRGFEWRYLWRLCQGDEIATLPGNGSVVSCVRFSPDGRLIASAGFDATVTIREAETYRVITRLIGLNGPVCRLAMSFSPDGRLLAAAGGTNLFIWNTADWSITRKLEAHSAPLPGSVYQVLFSPDGRQMAARFNQDVRIWEKTTWQLKLTIPGMLDETASLLAYSANGKTLATYSDHHVRFFDTETGRQRIISAETMSQLFGLAFRPDDTLLAVVSASGKLKLIDPQTGVTLKSVDAHAGSAQSVAFSPDGKILATGGADQQVRVWDVETLTNMASFKGHRNEVWSVGFSPNGELIVSASKDGTVKIWNARPGPGDIRTLDYASSPMWFSPDSKELLTKSWKGSLHYWDILSGRELRMVPPLQTGFERYFTTVSSDGKYLATSVEDGGVLLWNLETNTCLWTNHVDTNPANALAFSPDTKWLALSSGQYLAGSWQGGTKLLDLARGRIETLSTDYAGTRDAACVAFSPDGKLLAGAGPNYTVRVWDLAQRKLLKVLKGHTWDVMSLAFSPNGKLLASGGNDSTARLWDVASGTQLAALSGQKTGVVHVGFSPDGKTLATSGNDKTVRLWNVESHGELLTLKVATSWTHFLFSPDGRLLATGGTSGPLELWRAQ